MMVGSHVTLDGTDCPHRVGDSLAFGGIADSTFAIFGKADNRWRGPEALSVCNDDRASSFHDGKAGVCCSKVNSNYFAADFFICQLLHLCFFFFSA
jgi:hypothetical protein